MIKHLDKQGASKYNARDLPCGVGSMRIDEAISRFLDTKRARNADTAATYATTLRHFANHFGPKSKIQKVKRAGMAAYWAAAVQGLSPATRNNHRAILKSFWQFLDEVLELKIDRKAISEQTVPRSIVKREPAPRYTDEELALLRGYNPLIALLERCGLNFAFQPQDYCALRWTHITTNGGERAVLNMDRGKTGGHRHIALWPSTLDALDKAREAGLLGTDYVFVGRSGTPVKPRTVAWWWRAASKKLWIYQAGRGLRHLRHQSIDYYLQVAGLTEQDALQITGHMSTKSLAPYVNPRASRVEGLVIAAEMSTTAPKWHWRGEIPNRQKRFTFRVDKCR